MSLYEAYLNDIAERKEKGLHPKPIDNGELIKEILDNIIDEKSEQRETCLEFLIYNILPGTTDAASIKSNFLKNIILKNIEIKEISVSFAFELLSHMKGGPSIKVLLDLALGNNTSLAKKASKILMRQVFLYESDIERLKKSFNDNNAIANKIINSYANADFFSNLPDIKEEMLISSPAGVRAQLMNSNGSLEQDFDIRIKDNLISVLNAPSPAATSSLSIASYIFNVLKE